MIIGIDIDGTLAFHEEFKGPHVIADPDPRMVRIVKILHEEGHTLCTWTCRADYVVKAWLKKHDLLQFFEHINFSPLITDSIKPNFDLLIDDKVMRWMGQDFDAMQHLLHAGAGDIPRDPTFSDRPPVPYLAGTGKAYLDMFEEHWQKAWESHVFNKRVALFTICSHAKPYSKSMIHSAIRRKLWACNLLDKIDYIHISNAGIIPSGAEMTYPFNAYDHNGADMDPSIHDYFEELTENRMARWSALYGHNYDACVVYLRYGKTYRAAINGLEGRRTIPARASHEENLPHVAMPDPDDVLVSERNLVHLVDAMNTAFLHISQR